MDRLVYDHQMSSSLVDSSPANCRVISASASNDNTDQCRSDFHSADQVSIASVNMLIECVRLRLKTN